MADKACQRPGLRQVALQCFSLAKVIHHALTVTLKSLLK